jgi:hypothetical protein
MTISYDGRVFKQLSNSPTGEVRDDTVFRYHQKDDLVRGEYQAATSASAPLSQELSTTDPSTCDTNTSTPEAN